jgi:hypothetical protein
MTNFHESIFRRTSMVLSQVPITRIITYCEMLCGVEFA